MFKLSIKPQWRLQANDLTHELLSQLLDLLTAAHEEGNLSRAARKLGVSYRHAWGLIRKGGLTFGAPLLTMTRGRSATLTALGEKLVWGNKRIAARLAPILDSLASELEVEIERVLSESGSIFRIHASHGFAIEMLRDFLVNEHIPVDLKYRGSMEALASLCGLNCELAGFHVPLGEFQAPMLKFLAKFLKPEDQQLIHLATRRQGIMVAPGNPLGIVSVADFCQPEVRFVNRQYGSGTRILLDLMLKKENADSRQIAGYETGEFTHSGVAAYIASGMANAGFGVEAAARRFNLDFIPVISERYFLICRNDALASVPVTQILEILRSRPFRAAVNKLPGINASQAGTTMSIHEAFPDLPPLIKNSETRLAAAQE